MSWRYRRGFVPQWGISLVEADWKSKDAALRASRPVPNPPGRYFADPFVIERDGRTYCFVEDFVHARGKAHITVLEYRHGVATEVGPCLDEPFHLSFPFVFEYQGELYLCPEASQSRSVRMYRCVEFPLRWELARTALPGFPALDTLLFERQGRWWMLTCGFAGPHDPFGSELHVFHADSPLSEHWQPLPGNPVIADRRFRAATRMLLDRDAAGKLSEVCAMYAEVLRHRGEQDRAFAVMRMAAERDFSELSVLLKTGT